ncbi:MAG: four helix bundle protein [Chloroflexi bacterium]|nr:four helix bundle protein [Chloroflexota bacterium]MBP7043792.1 four helix bundle protein [Chloroflexota bacterium]
MVNVVSEIRSYRDLLVWQRAMDFSVHVYQVTSSFPSSEMYGLTNQMRRAAVSIPSNIAEGHMRTRSEFGHFLRIARGSLAELETQLELAQRIGYLPQSQHAELTTELSVIGKQLTNLTKKIDNKG